jgi:hypothetical protein
VRNTRIPLAPAVILLALLSSATPLSGQAPTRAYEDGVVWQLVFVRTKPGTFDHYMEALDRYFRLELEEAVRQGLLVDYKIITKWPASPDDWDVMIMEGYPNMAALDDFQAKWNAVDERVFATLRDRDEAIVDLGPLRTSLGRVIAREVLLSGGTGSGGG